MNRFIIILISSFLLSTPAFAPDVADACPNKFKYEKKVNDYVLVLSEQWKALNNTEKNYCDCRLTFPKPEACYDMWFSNIAETNCPLKNYDNNDLNKFKKNNKDKWKNLNAKEKNACETLIQLRTPQSKKTIADTPVIIALIVVSIFILFAFGEPIRKIINSKASNKKGKQQESEIKTINATAKPAQSEKAKPKKEILTWDEPLKSEPKKEEPKKEEPAKEEPQPAKVTITADEEEEIYAKIGKELKENRNEGAWLKAYTECDGDEQKAKIAYINNRAKTLMGELKKNKTGE